MDRTYLSCLAALLLMAVPAAGQPKQATSVELAMKEYLRAKENVEVRIEHLRVVGKFARATAAPIKADRDPVMVFMKKLHRQWIGLSYGTNFLPEDCQKLGLPSEICP
jgi:hypothetical protein